MIKEKYQYSHHYQKSNLLCFCDGYARFEVDFIKGASESDAVNGARGGGGGGA